MYPAPRDSLVTGEKYPYDRKDAKTSLISVVDQLQAGIAAKPNLSLSASVVSDVDVAGAIIKAGEDVEEGGGYEFIALSTHGRSGLERWKMGGITEQVLHRTRLPLLIMRPGDTGTKKVNDVLLLKQSDPGIARLP